MEQHINILIYVHWGLQRNANKLVHGTTHWMVKLALYAYILYLYFIQNWKNRITMQLFKFTFRFHCR